VSHLLQRSQDAPARQSRQDDPPHGNGFDLSFHRTPFLVAVEWQRFSGLEN
jgi:hypothetical protein